MDRRRRALYNSNLIYRKSELEGIFRFQVLSVATLLVMGIIAVYSVLLPPPEVFRLALRWTHILGHFSAYLVLFVLTYGVLSLGSVLYLLMVVT